MQFKTKLDHENKKVQWIYKGKSYDSLRDFLPTLTGKAYDFSKSYVLARYYKNDQQMVEFKYTVNMSFLHIIWSTSFKDFSSVIYQDTLYSTMCEFVEYNRSRLDEFCCDKVLFVKHYNVDIIEETSSEEECDNYDGGLYD